MSFPSNEHFARQGMCVCRTTYGESCRVCDGTADDEREMRRDLRESLRASLGAEVARDVLS